MTVLYIDDDFEDAEIFCEVIREIDPSIVCNVARNATEAIQILTSPCPDFIFIDYRMPIINGKVVLEKIRGNDCFKNTKVIMYSTYMHPDDLEECKKLGAYDCLKKSAELNVLRVDLQKLFRK